jgi:hypothetical protein
MCLQIPSPRVIKRLFRFLDPLGDRVLHLLLLPDVMGCLRAKRRNKKQRTTRSQGSGSTSSSGEDDEADNDTFTVEGGIWKPPMLVFEEVYGKVGMRWVETAGCTDSLTAPFVLG